MECVAPGVWWWQVVVPRVIVYNETIHFCVTSTVKAAKAALPQYQQVKEETDVADGMTTIVIHPQAFDGNDAAVQLC